MNISFFGGTGGLGKKTIEYLKDYNIDIVGSDKVNFEKSDEISKYFENKDLDVVVIFTNFNFNGFLHKYDGDSLKEMHKQIDVNIKGVIEVISNSLRVMRNKEYGRIILASSITVSETVPGTSIYASCKAFYESIVKNIAIENASKNITANCIQLGYMDGGLTYTLPKEFIDNKISTIPSKRLGSAEEISSTIDFLIKNSYINGTTIKLTGGL
jgi:NAD(P)-dependent dehydrogenase (short-subunit alcohol dehydrogenase family)